MRIDPRRLGYGTLAATALMLAAGGPIGVSVGLNSGQARDAALAIAAENAALKAANNLSDLVSPATARTSLGLGTAATAATTAFDAAGAAALVQGNLTTFQAGVSAALPSASAAFTPVILCGGAVPSAVTYTQQSGIAYKIGPVQFFSIVLAWSAMTCSGPVTLSGLSFSPLAGTRPDFPLLGDGLNTSSSPHVTVGTGGLLTALLSSNATTTANDAAMPGSSLAAAGEINISDGRYFVN